MPSGYCLVSEVRHTFEASKVGKFSQDALQVPCTRVVIPGYFVGLSLYWILKVGVLLLTKSKLRYQALSS
jgi:hypothetical protein